MPIKSLMATAGLPEIGQLRKGAPKPENGNKPGADLDHFRFTSSDATVVEAFKRAFGDKPQEVGFFLPFPTLGENFEWWQEAYTAGAIQHRCDGETCVGWRTPQGTWSAEAKPCPGGCKVSGRLKIFIPAFRRMVFVTVLTTSKYDIISLAGTLTALQTFNGSLQNIPLLLRRVEREISTPAGDGKRARRKKWLLQVEAEPQWAAMQFGAMREMAMITSSYQPLLLESGEVEDDDDDDEATQHQSEYASAETIAAVRNLWPQFGSRKSGQLVPFEIILRQNGWTLNTWPAERAAKTLADLQKRALAAAEAQAEEARSGEPTTKPALGDDASVEAEVI